MGIYIYIRYMVKNVHFILWILGTSYVRFSQSCRIIYIICRKKVFVKIILGKNIIMFCIGTCRIS